MLFCETACGASAGTRLPNDKTCVGDDGSRLAPGALPCGRLRPGTPVPAPPGPANGDPGGAGLLAVASTGAATGNPAESDSPLPLPRLASAGVALPGKAEKNAFARRDNMAASGKPAGAAPWGTSGSEALLTGLLVGVRIVMVLGDLHVIQNRQCVRRVHCERAIQRNQVRGDRVVVDANEAHRESRPLLACHARLEQANHALPLVTHAQQQDLGLAIGNRNLVRRYQRNATPREELGTKQAHGRRRHTATRALASERRDRQRMS